MDRRTVRLNDRVRFSKDEFADAEDDIANDKVPDLLSDGAGHNCVTPKVARSSAEAPTPTVLHTPYSLVNNPSAKSVNHCQS